MKNLAPGGGYIFSPSHYIMADVPIQNIMAMFEAQKDSTYGKSMNWRAAIEPGGRECLTNRCEDRGDGCALPPGTGRRCGPR
jgi:hypothetical protein